MGSCNDDDDDSAAAEEGEDEPEIKGTAAETEERRGEEGEGGRKGLAPTNFLCNQYWKKAEGPN